MTTEQDFNRFANLSYWVDKGKEDVPFILKRIRY